MNNFYVKSSIAGNYGFTAQYTDSGGTNRYIQRSYTVSAANTWERVSVTIPKNTVSDLLASICSIISFMSTPCQSNYKLQLP